MGRLVAGPFLRVNIRPLLEANCAAQVTQIDLD